MATTRHYQYNFSQILPDQMYNLQSRQRKARTIVAVLQSYFQSDLSELSLVDVGCSAGIIADHLADFFESVTAIDIDKPAINYAKSRFRKPNLEFLSGDLSELSIGDESTDVVVCAHVYEHVPDAVALLREIHRVLKPGGVCYFAAGNRLQVMEPHYRLPFLSVIPKFLGYVYMRVSGKGDFYYEKHLSYWGLKKLVRNFERIDYTRKLVEKPEAFGADYMLKRKSKTALLAKFIVNYAYWLFPSYIWLLRR